MQTVREKFICKACETIAQPPAPFHPIPRASAGPNLLAMVLFNKFGLHQPLNRQSETYAAEGMSISVSTLADYVGHGTVLLHALVDLIEAHILAGERIHHDDTTVPVMAAGKTITGRIWASVRDDHPFGGTDPPAVCYYYTRDRTGAHPQRQLARYAGILQADAYSCYDALYAAGRKPGPILEAPCWTHARRLFFKKARLSRTPLAVDIVTRMDAIFAAERVIWDRNASERLAARQVHVAPLIAELEQFLRQQYGRLSRKGDLAKAINYMLARWDSFARFVFDGRICMTNIAAERWVRTVAVGRRNCTFCGSDRGGDRAAAMYTLIQTCRLNDVDPHAWLREVIAQISDHPQTRLHELLPWQWKERQQRPEAIAQAAQPCLLQAASTPCDTRPDCWARPRTPSSTPRDLLPRFRAIGKLARQMETSDAAKPIYRGSDHWRAARA